MELNDASPVLDQPARTVASAHESTQCEMGQPLDVSLASPPPGRE